jgi:hypothetical protein
MEDFHDNQKPIFVSILATIKKYLIEIMEIQDRIAK